MKKIYRLRKEECYEREGTKKDYKGGKNTKALECIKNEMKQYSKMERYIEKLNYEEQVFLKLRYGKGYGYDYISLQTHKSRATCFRDHDLILDKLILLCDETQQNEKIAVLC